MNIFILSSNPVEAAQMQCDKHVVKMCLETAQMLSTIAGGPYKPTHANHPCTKWARACMENFLWLKQHGLALCDEYKRRYGKQHKCRPIIEEASAVLPVLGNTTPFALAMPDEYKQADAVAAYRAYYKSKREFARWSKARSAPLWWSE